MKVGYCVMILATILACTACQEEGEGERRLRRLRQMADESKGIITFSSEDYKYPIPSTLQLVRHAVPTALQPGHLLHGRQLQTVRVPAPICSVLKPEYEYMATLYEQQGATKSSKNPVFFAMMTFNRDSQPIFDTVFECA